MKERTKQITEKEVSSKNNWLDKLKPCPKNAIIKDKIFSSLNNSNVNLSKEVDLKITKPNKQANDDRILSGQEAFSFNYFKNTNASSESLDKCERYLTAGKSNNQNENLNEFFDLNLVDQSVVEKEKADVSFSIMSENINEINNLIEEKYNIALSENLFLRQEYHSIIPFLLLSSKSIHRMCLSDYEIKLVIKNFQKHSKCNRLECFDYYKIGLINFFKGNYVNAYNNFKRSYNMKLKDTMNSLSTNLNTYSNNNNNIYNNSNNYNNNLYLNSSGALNNLKKSNSDKLNSHSNNNKNTENTEFYFNSQPNNSIANIAKWLAFSGMILLFCECSQNSSKCKIDFRNINKIKLEQMEQEENNSNFIFNCCSVRKKSKIGDFAYGSEENNHNNKNLNNLIKCKNINSNNFTNLDNSLFGNDLSLVKHDVVSIAKEIEDLLTIVIENEKNAVEGCWLSMLIGIYCEANKNTKIFKQFLDPKLYIKKIKNIDNYLSYIVYGQMMYITKEDFKIDCVLNELIQKYKFRLEAYFFYWHLLYKGKYKNYSTAYELTEILLKITSLMKFDENNIYL